MSDEMEFDDDDLGLDDELGDLDFDLEGDMSTPPPANAREAVTRSISDGATGFVEGFTDDKLETAADIAKAAIPSSVSSEAAVVTDVVSTANEEFIKARDEVRKSGKKTLRSIKKLLPENETVKNITGKLNNWIGGEEPTAAEKKETQEQIQQQNINNDLIQLFGEQQSSDQREMMVLQQIATNRAKSQNEISSMIATNTNSVRKFQYEIANSFYRRSLELQYKQLFISKEQLAIMKASGDLFKNQLESIINNTGLPEIAKIQHIEGFEQTIRAKMQNELVDNLYSKVNPTELIKKNVKGYIENKKEKALGALEAASSGADQFSDMLGGEMGGMINPAALAGGMVSDSVKEKVGKFIGDKLGENATVKEKAFAFKNAMADLPNFMKEMEHEAGSKAGPLGWAGEKFFGELRELVSGGDKMNTVNLKRVDQNSAALFDNRAHNSLVKIIPGLLSKIYGEVKTARLDSCNDCGGDSNIPGESNGNLTPEAIRERKAKKSEEFELIYDDETDQFVSKGNFEKSLTDKVNKRVEKTLGLVSQNLVEKLVEADTDTNYTPDEISQIRTNIISAVIDKKSKVKSFTGINSKAFFKGFEDEELQEKIKKSTKKLSGKLKAAPDDLDQFNSNLRTIAETAPAMNKTIEDLFRSGNVEQAERMGLVKRDEITSELTVDNDRVVKMILDESGKLDTTKLTEELAKRKEAAKKLKDEKEAEKNRKAWERRPNASGDFEDLTEEEQAAILSNGYAEGGTVKDTKQKDTKAPDLLDDPKMIRDLAEAGIYVGSSPEALAIIEDVKKNPVKQDFDTVMSNAKQLLTEIENDKVNLDEKLSSVTGVNKEVEAISRYTRNGGKHEVAGIVHKDEFVTSKEDVGELNASISEAASTGDGSTLLSNVRNFFTGFTSGQRETGKDAPTELEVDKALDALRTAVDPVDNRPAALVEVDKALEEIRLKQLSNKNTPSVNNHPGSLDNPEFVKELAEAGIFIGDDVKPSEKPKEVSSVRAKRKPVKRGVSSKSKRGNKTARKANRETRVNFKNYRKNGGAVYEYLVHGDASVITTELDEIEKRIKYDISNKGIQWVTARFNSASEKMEPVGKTTVERVIAEKHAEDKAKELSKQSTEIANEYIIDNHNPLDITPLTHTEVNDDMISNADIDKDGKVTKSKLTLKDYLSNNGTVYQYLFDTEPEVIAKELPKIVKELARMVKEDGYEKVSTQFKQSTKNLPTRIKSKLQADILSASNLYSVLDGERRIGEVKKTLETQKEKVAKGTDYLVNTSTGEIANDVSVIAGKGKVRLDKYLKQGGDVFTYLTETDPEIITKDTKLIISTLTTTVKKEGLPYVKERYSEVKSKLPLPLQEKIDKSINIVEQISGTVTENKYVKQATESVTTNVKDAKLYYNTHTAEEITDDINKKIDNGTKKAEELIDATQKTYVESKEKIAEKKKQVELNTKNFVKYLEETPNDIIAKDGIKVLQVGIKYLNEEGVDDLMANWDKLRDKLPPSVRVTLERYISEESIVKNGIRDTKDYIQARSLSEIYTDATEAVKEIFNNNIDKDLIEITEEEEETLRVEFFNSPEYKSGQIDNFQEYLKGLGFRLPEGWISKKTAWVKQNLYPNAIMDKLAQKATDKLKSFNKARKLKLLTSDENAIMRKLYIDSPEYQDGKIDDYDKWLEIQGYRKESMWQKFKKQFKLKTWLERTRKLDRKIVGAAFKGAKAVTKFGAKTSFDIASAPGKAVINLGAKGLHKVGLREKDHVFEGTRAGKIAGGALKAAMFLPKHAVGGVASLVPGSRHLGFASGGTRSVDKKILRAAVGGGGKAAALAAKITGKGLMGTPGAALSVGGKLVNVLKPISTVSSDIRRMEQEHDEKSRARYKEIAPDGNVDEAMEKYNRPVVNSEVASVIEAINPTKGDRALNKLKSVFTKKEKTEDKEIAKESKQTEETISKVTGDDKVEASKPVDKSDLSPTIAPEGMSEKDIKEINEQSPENKSISLLGKIVGGITGLTGTVKEGTASMISGIGGSISGFMSDKFGINKENLSKGVGAVKGALGQLAIVKAGASGVKKFHRGIERAGSWAKRLTKLNTDETDENGDKKLTRLGKIVKGGSEIGKWMKRLLVPVMLLVGYGKKLWTGIKEGTKQIWKNIKSAGTKIWDGVKGLGTTIWEGIKGIPGAIGKAVSDAISGIKKKVTKTYNKVKDKVVNTYSDAKSSIKSFFGFGDDKLSKAKKLKEEQGRIDRESRANNILTKASVVTGVSAGVVNANSLNEEDVAETNNNTDLIKLPKLNREQLASINSEKIKPLENNIIPNQTTVVDNDVTKVRGIKLPNLTPGSLGTSLGEQLAQDEIAELKAQNLKERERQEELAKLLKAEQEHKLYKGIKGSAKKEPTKLSPSPNDKWTIEKDNIYVVYFTPGDETTLLGKERNRRIRYMVRTKKIFDDGYETIKNPDVGLPAFKVYNKKIVKEKKEKDKSVWSAFKEGFTGKEYPLGDKIPYSKFDKYTDVNGVINIAYFAPGDPETLRGQARNQRITYMTIGKKLYNDRYDDIKNADIGIPKWYNAKKRKPIKPKGDKRDIKKDVDGDSVAMPNVGDSERATKHIKKIKNDLMELEGNKVNVIQAKPGNKDTAYGRERNRRLKYMRKSGLVYDDTESEISNEKLDLPKFLTKKPKPGIKKIEDVLPSESIAKLKANLVDGKVPELKDSKLQTKPVVQRPVNEVENNVTPTSLQSSTFNNSVTSNVASKVTDKTTKVIESLTPIKTQTNIDARSSNSVTTPKMTHTVISPTVTKVNASESLDSVKPHKVTAVKEPTKEVIEKVAPKAENVITHKELNNKIVEAVTNNITNNAGVKHINNIENKTDKSVINNETVNKETITKPVTSNKTNNATTNMVLNTPKTKEVIAKVLPAVTPNVVNNITNHSPITNNVTEGNASRAMTAGNVVESTSNVTDKMETRPLGDKIPLGAEEKFLTRGNQVKVVSATPASPKTLRGSARNTRIKYMMRKHLIFDDRQSDIKNVDIGLPSYTEASETINNVSNTTTTVKPRRVTTVTNSEYRAKPQVKLKPNEPLDFSKPGNESIPVDESLPLGPKIKKHRMLDNWSYRKKDNTIRIGTARRMLPTTQRNVAKNQRVEYMRKTGKIYDDRKDTIKNRDLGLPNYFTGGDKPKQKIVKPKEESSIWGSLFGGIKEPEENTDSTVKESKIPETKSVIPMGKPIRKDFRFENWSMPPKTNKVYIGVVKRAPENTLIGIAKNKRVAEMKKTHILFDDRNEKIKNTAIGFRSFKVYDVKSEVVNATEDKVTETKIKSTDTKTLTNTTGEKPLGKPIKKNMMFESWSLRKGSNRVNIGVVRKTLGRTLIEVAKNERTDEMKKTGILFDDRKEKIKNTTFGFPSFKVYDKKAKDPVERVAPTVDKTTDENGVIMGSKLKRSMTESWSYFPRTNKVNIGHVRPNLGKTQIEIAKNVRIAEMKKTGILFDDRKEKIKNTSFDFPSFKPIKKIEPVKKTLTPDDSVNDDSETIGEGGVKLGKKIPKDLMFESWSFNSNNNKITIGRVKPSDMSTLRGQAKSLRVAEMKKTGILFDDRKEKIKNTEIGFPAYKQKTDRELLMVGEKPEEFAKGGLVGTKETPESRYTGKGAKHTPAGTVHKDEFVISKNKLAKVNESISTSAKTGNNKPVLDNVKSLLGNIVTEQKEAGAKAPSVTDVNVALKPKGYSTGGLVRDNEVTVDTKLGPKIKKSSYDRFAIAGNKINIIQSKAGDPSTYRGQARNKRIAFMRDNGTIFDDTNEDIKNVDIGLPVFKGKKYTPRKTTKTVTNPETKDESGFFGSLFGREKKVEEKSDLYVKPTDRKFTEGAYKHIYKDSVLDGGSNPRLGRKIKPNSNHTFKRDGNKIRIYRMSRIPAMSRRSAAHNERILYMAKFREVYNDTNSEIKNEDLGLPKWESSVNNKPANNLITKPLNIKPNDAKQDVVKDKVTIPSKPEVVNKTETTAKEEYKKTLDAAKSGSWLDNLTSDKEEPIIKDEDEVVERTGNMLDKFEFKLGKRDSRYGKIRDARIKIMRKRKYLFDDTEEAIKNTTLGLPKYYQDKDFYNIRMENIRKREKREAANVVDNSPEGMMRDIMKMADVTEKPKVANKPLKTKPTTKIVEKKNPVKNEIEPIVSGEDAVIAENKVVKPKTVSKVKEKITPKVKDVKKVVKPKETKVNKVVSKVNTEIKKVKEKITPKVKDVKKVVKPTPDAVNHTKATVELPIPTIHKPANKVMFIRPHKLDRVKRVGNRLTYTRLIYTHGHGKYDVMRNKRIQVMRESRSIYDDTNDKIKNEKLGLPKWESTGNEIPVKEDIVKKDKRVNNVPVITKKNVKDTLIPKPVKNTDNKMKVIENQESVKKVNKEIAQYELKQARIKETRNKVNVTKVKDTLAKENLEKLNTIDDTLKESLTIQQSMAKSLTGILENLTSDKSFSPDGIDKPKRSPMREDIPTNGINLGKKRYG